jgi:hypothetical protein
LAGPITISSPHDAAYYQQTDLQALADGGAPINKAPHAVAGDARWMLVRNRL